MIAQELYNRMARQAIIDAMKEKHPEFSKIMDEIVDAGLKTAAEFFSKSTDESKA